MVIKTVKKPFELINNKCRHKLLLNGQSDLKSFLNKNLHSFLRSIIIRASLKIFSFISVLSYSDVRTPFNHPIQNNSLDSVKFFNMSSIMYSMFIIFLVGYCILHKLYYSQLLTIIIFQKMITMVILIKRRCCRLTGTVA